MVEIIFIIFFVLQAIILHEWAHGWVAYKLGDPTAKEAGRLSLNPIRHIDPVGTLILPGILLTLRYFGYPTILFGWAKPVPINFAQLSNPKRDIIFVGLAGPAINFIFVAFYAILFRIINSNFVMEILAYGVYVNLILACFNLIPIPPLDGSRFFIGILPESLSRPYRQLEPYGMIIIFALLYFGLISKILTPVIDFFLKIFLGASFS